MPRATFFAGQFREQLGLLVQVVRTVLSRYSVIDLMPLGLVAFAFILTLFPLVTLVPFVGLVIEMVGGLATDT